ncbi:MAG: methyltransferase domain-containing protein [candidate division WOR-3 bacterium]
MIDRDYIPVAPAWERKPDDPDIWRRVTVMPSLALNKAEMEFLGAVAGKRLAVLGSGDGIIPLALAAMGAKVTVIDPTNSGLDVLLVRTQIVGVELDFRQAELTDLSSLGVDWCEVAYAGQVAGLIDDLGRFYHEIYKMLVPGGRLVINEYHPFGAYLRRSRVSQGLVGPILSGTVSVPRRMMRWMLPLRAGFQKGMNTFGPCLTIFTFLAGQDSR